MAIKRAKKEMVNDTSKKKDKAKKRPNWIVRITILVIGIPFLILAIILLTSIEKQGEPVFGDRFDNQLNPKIKDNEVKSLQDSLVYAETEKVEVNLISATLRISIDTIDGLDAGGIEAIANDIYAKVDAALPINDYFTNKEKTKMYDLEINVYNLIPDETNAATPRIWCVKHKNASESELGTDWPSTVKNEEVSNKVKSGSTQ